MKTRIFVILLLAIILVGIVIAEQFFVSDTIDYLKQEATTLQTEIKQNEDINKIELINKIDDLDKNWTKKENIMCLLFNHKDMEKVGEQIKKLKVLIIQNKKEEAEYEVELLTFYVEGYEHFISISFQNIF